MKLGSNAQGKKVYQALLKEIDQHNITKKTLSTAQFFNLQKYFNNSRSIQRILNRKHYSSLTSMSWKQQYLDGLGTYKSFTVTRKTTV